MTLRKVVLGLIVFVSGAVVLALELIAGRFLTVKFGSAVFVWGNLIGVFLAGLSVGYYSGGHIADRKPTFLGFATLLFVTAVLLLTLPLYATLVRDAIFEMIDLAMVDRTGPLLSSLALFLVPTTALGMVSPYAVRLLADDPSKLGRQVGALYALSTLGSIVGALGATFFLTVVMGTNSSFYLFGAVQFGLACVAFVYQANARAGRAGTGAS